MPGRTQAATCPICAQSYSNKFNMQRHCSMIHLHLLRFVCEQCGKSLSSKQNHREHMYTHTGEKPFECKDCGARFRQCSQLSVHKRMHKKSLAQSCELKLTDLLNAQTLKLLDTFEAQTQQIVPLQPLPALICPTEPVFLPTSFSHIDNTDL